MSPAESMTLISVVMILGGRWHAVIGVVVVSGDLRINDHVEVESFLLRMRIDKWMSGCRGLLYKERCKPRVLIICETKHGHST